MPAATLNVLYRMRDLPSITGLSRSELYRRIDAGRFPRPVPLGIRAVAWRSAEVLRWLEDPLSYQCAVDPGNQPTAA